MPNIYMTIHRSRSFSLIWILLWLCACTTACGPVSYALKNLGENRARYEAVYNSVELTSDNLNWQGHLRLKEGDPKYFAEEVIAWTRYPAVKFQKLLNGDVGKIVEVGPDEFSAWTTDNDNATNKSIVPIVDLSEIEVWKIPLHYNISKVIFRRKEMFTYNYFFGLYNTESQELIREVDFSPPKDLNQTQLTSWSVLTYLLMPLACTVDAVVVLPISIAMIGLMAITGTGLHG